MTWSPQRRSVLLAALGFALVERRSAPLSVLHSWLSTWTGIGHVVAGLHRQGLRRPPNAVRRTRVAGDVLRHRHGALGPELYRVGVGDALFSFRISASKC